MLIKKCYEENTNYGYAISLRYLSNSQEMTCTIG